MKLLDIKLDNCCCCVETRIGCIIIGVVGAVTAVLTVAFNGGIPEYLGIPVTFVGCGCLIYAATNTSGNDKRRISAVSVYLVTLLFRGILNFITAGKHSFGQGESPHTNRGVKAISRHFSNYSEKAHLGQSPA